MFVLSVACATLCFNKVKETYIFLSIIFSSAIQKDPDLNLESEMENTL